MKKPEVIWSSDAEKHLFDWETKLVKPDPPEQPTKVVARDDGHEVGEGYVCHLPAVLKSALLHRGRF